MAERFLESNELCRLVAGWTSSILAGAILAASLTTGCAPTARRIMESSEGTSSRASTVEKWGIEVVSLRRTAAETMIDFRYRIVDPEKATFLVDRTIEAYLIDQRTGHRFGVPNTAKIGPLRQTTKFGEPETGRIFFILFANPGRFIQAGDEVTISIGNFRAQDLIVE